MALSTPKLALPDSEETIAFRAVESILRSDADLSRVIKTFVAWRGEPVDNEPPTASMCPYLMIVPSARPSGWVTEGQHEEPLQIGIFAAVVGSDADQIMNLWGAIRRALFPQDATQRTSVLTKVNAAGIVNGEITMPAYTVKAEKGDQVVMLGTGTLELYLMVNT